MKIHNKVTLFTLLTLGTTGSFNAISDADIAIQPTGTALRAQANVDFCIEIPSVLIFGVGALGDEITKVKWAINPAGTYAVADAPDNEITYNGPSGNFTDPAPFDNTTNITTTLERPGTSTVAANTATVPYFLFNNNGADVNINVDITGDMGGGGTAEVLSSTAGNEIPSSEIAVVSTGGVNHPATLINDDIVNTAGAAVINLSGTWAYTYTPATVPVAGTYHARAVYTATSP